MIAYKPTHITIGYMKYSGNVKYKLLQNTLHFVPPPPPPLRSTPMAATALLTDTPNKAKCSSKFLLFSVNDNVVTLMDKVIKLSNVQQNVR